MSETKFTPKPIKCVAMQFGKRENKGLVAFWTRMEEPALSASYARLVSAAPEMYEALKLIVEDAERAANPCSRMFAYPEARAALAKAGPHD